MAIAVVVILLLILFFSSSCCFIVVVVVVSNLVSFVVVCVAVRVVSLSLIKIAAVVLVVCWCSILFVFSFSFLLSLFLPFPSPLLFFSLTGTKPAPPLAPTGTLKQMLTGQTTTGNASRVQTRARKISPKFFRPKFLSWTSPRHGHAKMLFFSWIRRVILVEFENAMFHRDFGSLRHKTADFPSSFAFVAPETVVFPRVFLGLLSHKTRERKKHIKNTHIKN